MSVTQMAKVWKHEFPHNHQSIMLALTDHANDEGGSIYPSIGRVAWKTGYSTGSVKRIIKELLTSGVLILVRYESRHQPRRYKVDWTKATKKTAYEGGIKIVPLDLAVSKKNLGVSNGNVGVSNQVLGVSPMTPKPSVKPSVIKPSVNQKINPHREMCGILAKVTVLDLKLQGARIGKLAKELIKAGYMPQVIKDGYLTKLSWWYKTDWRGRNNSVPTLENIKETIGQVSNMETTLETSYTAGKFSDGVES